MARHQRIAPQDTSDKSRLFAVAFLRFFLRICRRQSEVFHGDMDLALIAETVAIAGIEAPMRDPSFKARHQSLSSIVGMDEQRPCNALSIAQTLGMPRETVRRKLRQLKDMGIVVSLPDRSYVLKPGVIQGELHGGLFRDIEAETLRMVNDCLTEEAFKVAH
jgi:DNA-binding transcriptional ArsR family regulator